LEILAGILIRVQLGHSLSTSYQNLLKCLGAGSKAVMRHSAMQDLEGLLDHGQDE
jgi:hypothetical protein